MTDYLPPISRPRMSDEDKNEVLDTMMAVRHVGIVMVIAAGVLMLFNSSGLKTWARNQAGSVMTDRWVTEADNWHNLMARLGFAAPKSVIRAVMEDARQVGWSGGTSPTSIHAQATVDGDKEDDSDLVWTDDDVQD